MSAVTGRAFVTISDVKTDKLQAGNTDTVNAKVGGRVDWRHSVRDVDITVSGTDASARDYESVPWIKDAVITADTRFRGALPPGCHWAPLAEGGPAEPTHLTFSS